jgi:hypothetical protein
MSREAKYYSNLKMLRANADRCRALAQQASDPEAAESLAELASDIDAALPILTESLRRTG